MIMKNLCFSGGCFTHKSSEQHSKYKNCECGENPAGQRQLNRAVCEVSPRSQQLHPPQD